MLTGFPAAYFAIKAFSETDMSADLKKIGVPTLILHGDVDQIVPIGNAYRSSKLIPNATLKVYPGAPHAIISTSKSQVNEDLLNFVKVGQNQNKGGSTSQISKPPGIGRRSIHPAMK
jgi:non-heme chloroperoxidase